MSAREADWNAGAGRGVFIDAGAQHQASEGCDADHGRQSFPDDLVDEKPKLIGSGQPTLHCAPTSTGSTAPGPTSVSASAQCAGTDCLLIASTGAGTADPGAVDAKDQRDPW